MISQKQQNIIDSAISEYKSNGVCVVKGLLDTNEIELLQKEASRLWSDQKDLNSLNLRVGTRKDLDGKDVLERLDPVVDISKIFSDLNEDERILKLAEIALGEKVMVMKEKLIYKWPGSSGYGAHRDGAYFKVSENAPESNEILSIIIALDKVDAENGATKFYPTLRFKELASPAEEARDIDDAEIEGEPFLMPELNPGDIVLFDGNMPHSSDFNKSQRTRRIYIITYAFNKYTNCREDYYASRHKEMSKERGLGTE